MRTLNIYGSHFVGLFSYFTLLLLAGWTTSSLEEEKRPTYLVASVGDAVAFNCHLDFPQDIVIPYELHWKKEGDLVFSWRDGVLTSVDDYSGRVRLLAPPYGQGSVNLTNIRESDAGWYECRVFFPNRSPTSRANGTWFHLTVDGDHLIAVPPVNQTVMEGDTVHFPCVTKDRSSAVAWFKDGIPLSEMHELLVRSLINPEGSLTISPTQMGDLGEYACEVTGINGDIQRTTAFLNVQYKAKVLYAPREVFMPIGRPGLLDCHFRANPPLTNLRWEKDGFLFDPFNVRGVYFRRNGSLYFKEVDESHGGNYTCTPFNELGTEGPSPVMTVVVQHPPIFSLSPHNLYLRRRGDTVEMPCDAWNGASHYKPSIVWAKKDGSPLPPGRTILSASNLTIESVEEDDRGIYQCIATNEAATRVVETELMVENVAPRAPYNLLASPGTSSITVSWASGLTAPKLADSVWYRAADVPLWRAVPAGDSHQLTLENLLSGTEYEVMVLSQDPHGDGMFSKSIRSTTLGVPDAPIQQFQKNLTDEWHIGPPRNLNVELEKDGYLVTWQGPEESLENVSHYTVRWFWRPGQGGSIDTTDTSHRVDTLEEEKTYSFQVFAVSSDGQVAESTKFLVHVPSYRPVRALSITLGLSLLLLVLAVGGWLVRRRVTLKSFF